MISASDTLCSYTPRRALFWIALPANARNTILWYDWPSACANCLHD